MSLRTALLALPLALVLAASFASAEAESTPAAGATTVDALLQKSQVENKGLMFYVGGQAIPGVVTAIDAEYVSAKNREYGIILIRRDRIDAVAGD